MLQRVLDYSHDLLQQFIHPGEIVIDGTTGNGYDTLYLSQIVGGGGHVYAFDIQEEAIRNTQQKLQTQNIQNVTLIQDSHDQFQHYLPEGTKEIGGAIFNLGFLPGSDKTVITRPKSTLKAVKGMLDYLKKQGILILVVYHGHPGGDEEKEALLNYLSTLNQQAFTVLRYGFINQVNSPPFILAIEKK